MDTTILGLMGPGFRNQVPTLPFEEAHSKEVRMFVCYGSGSPTGSLRLGFGGS